MQAQQAGRVQVAVFDLSGGRVRVLIDGETGPGEPTIQWDGRNSSGQLVSNGIYIVRLEIQGKATTSKLVLLR